MKTNEDVKVNRGYKDTLFRFLIGNNKENALSLYNAVNGSNYTNAEELEFTTLEDVIYMKMKNDVSFVFGYTLSLYEHQSSYNPNMPLRGLFYFADLYRQLISDSESLYGRKLIKIPTPKYIVFYNGPEGKQTEDKWKLKLSDAFEYPDNEGDFEWTATMININSGKNELLKEKCKILNEYCIFVEKVKRNHKKMSYAVAIDVAVEECIKENVLRDVLMKHRREVKDMCLTEFDEKKYGELCHEEGREEGREEGEECLARLMQLLMEAGRNDDLTKAVKDKEFRKTLYHEYGIKE